MAASTLEAIQQAPQHDGQSSKAWKTAQARCLLAGFQAVLSDDDAGRPMLIVSRWAMTRGFADLAELDQWLRRLKGGGAA